MGRTNTTSASAPTAIGPYSQGVWAGEFLYLSGQTPIDPSTGKLVDGGIASQTRRAFLNLQSVLDSAGLTMDHVIKVNVYLTDMADFPVMNSEYQSFFNEPYPARSTVAVAALPLGARVEIELIARKG